MVHEGIILGDTMSKRGIEVDKAKVDLILKLPHPSPVKQIRSFLGHVDFYQRFIKDFSKISKPLCELLAKDGPFEFNEACVQAFEKLQESLSITPVMQIPDWSSHLRSGVAHLTMQLVLSWAKGLKNYLMSFTTRAKPSMMCNLITQLPKKSYSQYYLRKINSSPTSWHQKSQCTMTMLLCDTCCLRKIPIRV